MKIGIETRCVEARDGLKPLTRWAAESVRFPAIIAEATLAEATNTIGELVAALTALESVAKYGGLPIQGELADARAVLAKAKGEGK